MTRLRNVDILCLSSIDWDFIWQGHQEIMSAFAAHGNRVLFIENTGVRSAQFRDWSRLLHRLQNWLKSTKGFREVRERLFVYSPIILPFPYSRIARWINRRLLLQALQRWMRATGFRRPLVWTFLPTPLMRELIRDLNPELTIYYCIDDLASSSPQARRIGRSEEQIFREADLVFVTSEKLRQRAIRFNERVHFFPFGVDFEQFAKIRDGAQALPDELCAIPRSVIGYVGGVHQWVDQDLLCYAADRMPSTSFVLVGPLQVDVSRLSRCPNVHLLGGKPHAEVPRYLKGFDVGMIPYRLSEYTAHVYPTKLNEYLAMGIPVVATDLVEIQRFNREYGEAVSVARDPEEFVRALQRALEPATPDGIQRRIAVSQANSWQARIQQMSLLIEERLAARQQGAQQWDVSLRRLYRTARRRAARWIVAVAAGYLLLFHSPLPWWVASPLRVADWPRQADAIVVFAGGVGESGQAGGGYQERVKQAVDLYRAGQAPRMIFSSGYSFVFLEAQVMKELAVTQGVPESAIILEPRAANTYQNVQYVADLLRVSQWRSILLVSSPYHMRRAVLTWRKMAPEVTVIASPVPESQFYLHGRGASLAQLLGIVHEYAGLFYYWWRGWL